MCKKTKFHGNPILAPIKSMTCMAHFSEKDFSQSQHVTSATRRKRGLERTSHDSPHHSAIDSKRRSCRRGRLHATYIRDHRCYLVRRGESLKHGGGTRRFEELPFHRSGVYPTRRCHL